MGIRPTLGLLIAWALAAARPAEASLLWTWSYSEAGISAGGTLTTDDAVNAAGFFPITGISARETASLLPGCSQRARRSPATSPSPSTI
jgi:hypothetical protein